MTGSLAQSLGGHDSAQWAKDFLKGIGAPTTPANVAFIEKWEVAESGRGGGMFNPLNSVQGAPGATNLNSVGVKNYTSYQQGLNASIATFTQTQWSGVVSALKANNQIGAQAAINAEYGKWNGGKGINILGANAGAIGPAGPQGQAAAAAGLAAADAGCLVKVPTVGVGPVHVGGQCLVSVSEGRALLGAVSLVAGVLVMLAGIGFVALGTKPGRAVSSAAIATGAAAAA